MSSDKKTPQKSSELFHNIMKASVAQNNNQYDVAKCPDCGATGTKIAQQKKGKSLVMTFKCPNGHTFFVKFD